MGEMDGGGDGGGGEGSGCGHIYEVRSATN